MTTSDSEPVIRRAGVSDAAVLAAMRYEFRAALGEPTESESLFVARAGSWMAERLVEHSAWRCWLAELDGRVVGHIWLQLIEKIPNPVIEREKHGYITNAYVRETVRGQGIGDALLRQAMEYCRAEGVDSVLLWPRPRSRSLYARHGFAVRDDVMEAHLDPERQRH